MGDFLCVVDDCIFISAPLACSVQLTIRSVWRIEATALDINPHSARCGSRSNLLLPQYEPFLPLLYGKGLVCFNLAQHRASVICAVAGLALQAAMVGAEMIEVETT